MNASKLSWEVAAEKPRLGQDATSSPKKKGSIQTDTSLTLQMTPLITERDARGENDMNAISMLVAMVAGAASVQMDRQSAQAAGFEARYSTRSVAGAARMVSGSAAFRPDGTLQATLRVKIASFAFGDSTTIQYLREVLDAKRYPFVDVSLHTAAKNSYRQQPGGDEVIAIGTVTMHGVSRAIEVALRVAPANGKGVTISGDVPLSFENFAVTEVALLSVPIAPNLRLHFEVNAPQPPATDKTGAVAGDATTAGKPILTVGPPVPGGRRCPPLCAD
jgi:hypothetical protein